jgi:hypothetical protein
VWTIYCTIQINSQLIIKINLSILQNNIQAMFQAEKKERFHDLITFVSVKPVKKLARGVEKPGIEIAYTPIYKDGRAHTGAPWTKSAFADSLKGCKNVLTSLREGDAATLELTINGQYKNLAGVIAGHVENPNRVPMKGATSSGTPSFGVKKSGGNDYNERAAKGQALNLAMTVAIAQGKFDDDAYILSLIPRMLKLGEAAQNDGIQLQTTEQPVTAPTRQEAVQGTTPTYASPVTATQSSTTSESTIQQGSLDSELNDLFGGV